MSSGTSITQWDSAPSPKRRKPAPRVEDPTPPAEPHAGEIGGKIEALWKTFDALGRKHQRRFIHDACLRLGFDPLLMAPLAAFGLADEEPELAVDSPAEVPPASDDAPQDSLATDDAAADSLSTDDGAVESQAEPQDDAPDLGAENLQDAGEDVSKAADQEPAGATNCAYCNIKFESGDQLEEFNGQLFHAFCVEDGKRLAKAKQGKQIAIAA